MSILAALNAGWTSYRAPKLEAKAIQKQAKALGEPASRLGRFNRDSAARHGWTLPLLRSFGAKRGIEGPESFDDGEEFERLQAALGVTADGWFGPASYAALMRHYADHIIVGGYPFPAPAGIVVRNWYGSGIRRFPATCRRGREVSQALAHESVTTSRVATENVLSRRALGVHLMVTPETVDGVCLVTQHADLLWDRLAHAGGHNGLSVAIEYVNPYYPESAGDFPREAVLDSVGWADDGRDKLKNYLVMPLRMLEAGAVLIGWLAMPEGPIGIPLEWPGHDVAGRRFALNRIAVNPRKPGIWAHTYTAHADGAFPVLYSWLRIVGELGRREALDEAVRLAAVPGRWARL